MELSVFEVGVGEVLGNFSYFVRFVVENSFVRVIDVGDIDISGFYIKSVYDGFDRVYGGKYSMGVGGVFFNKELGMCVDEVDGIIGGKNISYFESSIFI